LTLHRTSSLASLLAADGAWPKFTVRYVGVASVAAKPAQGRPRRFGSAVGCADYPVVLAPLAWRITRYALRAALGQMRQV
jgi:hypothetical protein